MNLKRSDEDKARDGGAAVVSESVFSPDHFRSELRQETKLRHFETFYLLIQTCFRWISYLHSFLPGGKEVVGEVVHVTSPGLKRDLPMLFPRPVLPCLALPH